MTATDVNFQFGKNLTALRKKSRMTRKQLAEILDVTEMAVGTYERGIRTPSLEKILQLAEIFQVSTDDLLKNDTAEKISSDITHCVFAVGDNKTEFDIPSTDEQQFLTSIKLTTELLKVVGKARKNAAEKNQPLNVLVSLTPTDAKE